ncbi:hypothetical protein L1I30_03695 [Gillisia sp. M10.2A]|uniref:Uncharacterized protein n=1 Tax=Gillisia lutea TaxID=2909668 RepID=A0ABS9EF25_9FLAO|nr:hypothetical protein [Gillisia lutea]MCF4100764.1 hypothetical protein [Gillisia lutea]
MKIVLVLLCLLGLSVNAQVDSDGDIISLKTGEGFQMKSTAVIFKEVISDSRCPQNVTCIWAGEAKILIEITNCGKLVTAEEIVIFGAGIGFTSSPLHLLGEYFNMSITEVYLSPNVETVNESEKEYYLRFKLKNIKV